MWSLIFIFTIPVVYLIVEEREGRMENPHGPPFIKRLIASFRAQSGWLFGAFIAGFSVGYRQGSWHDAIGEGIVGLGLFVILTLRDAVAVLKRVQPSKPQK